MTHYDSYGNCTVYEDRIEAQMPKMFLDLSFRDGEHRYLLWVSTDHRSATGQRKTYRSKSAAIRQAKRLRKRGHGVRVSDRLIRRGDSGFLADHSGSYYRALDGTLHTGTHAEISALREKVGYWSSGGSLVVMPS